MACLPLNFSSLRASSASSLLSLLLVFRCALLAGGQQHLCGPRGSKSLARGECPALERWRPHSAMSPLSLSLLCFYFLPLPVVMRGSVPTVATVAAQVRLA